MTLGRAAPWYRIAISVAFIACTACATERPSPPTALTSSPLGDASALAICTDGSFCRNDGTLAYFEFQKLDDPGTAERVKAALDVGADWFIYLSYLQGSNENRTYARFASTDLRTGALDIAVSYSVARPSGVDTSGVVSVSSFCGITEGASIQPLLLGVAVQDGDDTVPEILFSVPVTKHDQGVRANGQPAPWLRWPFASPDCEEQEMPLRTSGYVWPICYRDGDEEEQYWCSSEQNEELTYLLFMPEDDALDVFVGTAYANAERTGNEIDSSVGSVELTAGFCTPERCMESEPLLLSPLQLRQEGAESLWWYTGVEHFLDNLDGEFVQTAYDSRNVRVEWALLRATRPGSDALEVSLVGNPPRAHFP